MEVYKPLRISLFAYETLRLLLLTGVLAFFSEGESVIRGGVFPYLVYLSPNALFPLISLFLLLRPGEYRHFLLLYLAGKTIAVILFIVWTIFYFPPEFGFARVHSFMEGMILLGGAFFINLGDALSVLGVWILKRKLETIIRGGQ